MRENKRLCSKWNGVFTKWWKLVNWKSFSASLLCSGPKKQPGWWEGKQTNKHCLSLLATPCKHENIIQCWHLPNFIKSCENKQKLTIRRHLIVKESKSSVPVINKSWLSTQTFNCSFYSCLTWSFAVSVFCKIIFYSFFVWPYHIPILVIKDSDPFRISKW